MIPYRIYLYNEIPSEDLDLKRVLEYLDGHCSFAEIVVRESFISHFFSDKMTEGLADCWRTDLLRGNFLNMPEEKRLDYEQQAYLRPETISPHVIYHGWQLLELLQSQIPQKETPLNHLHIFLTPRLLATQDQEDIRYHARTILMGQPSIISSSGLVEAPARPVEYYFLQTAYRRMGQEITDSVLKKEFGNRFLTYHDPRLTEVIIGYILQAIAYRYKGEGFCKDPHCRLFNAHRQQEMLSAQLEPPEFCSRHKTLLSRRC